MSNREPPGEHPALVADSEGAELSLASAEMIEAIHQRMPFGKYQGKRLLDIPEPYLVWFKQRGFPPGRLGSQMALIYEIRLNGLEKLVRPLLRQEPDDKE